jgi:hypothetical protein
LEKEEKSCSNSLLYDLLNYSNLGTEGTARGYIRGRSHLLSGVAFPLAVAAAFPALEVKVPCLPPARDPEDKTSRQMIGWPVPLIVK